MKHLAIITFLTVVTLTQSFANPRTRQGERGYYPTRAPHNPSITGRDYGRSIGRQVIDLNINQTYFRGGVIALKREIKMQNPHMNLQQMKLLAVVLVAKSKHGRGEATLNVGYQSSYPQTVPGNPYDFQRPSAYTYKRVQLKNPSFDSQGKWQIELKGLIKVSKVRVIVESSAYSQVQSIMIPMGEQESFGVKNIPLKVLIKRQMPHLNLQNAELVKVVVMAKSRFGRGQASLVVGQSMTYPVTVPGRPRAYDSRAPRSFTPLHIVNNTRHSHGKWQVELRGQVKVQHILVELKSNSYPGQVPGRGPGRRY